jgi:hypothetical protein
MANPKIEVEVVAKVDGLNSGVAAATNGLDKLGKAAQKTTPQVEKLTKATSRYNVVGLDFARIIQDAPFGIIGVGNNITQLAQSFSSLGKAGDTLGTKVKLAFGQIFSSGNALVLGISILTTAFTILQQKGFFKTEEDAKSLDETLKEYQETLSGVAAATLKGAQDAQKEIASLKALEIQATNTSLSTKQRSDAVKELQELYPQYFSNLTEEQIKNGDVGEAYSKVTANLLAKAKAQAAVNEIAENGIALLRIETKLEEQRNQRLLKTSAAQAQIDALIEKRQKEGFLTQGDLQRYDTLIKSINNSNESLEEETKLKNEIAKINTENQQLTSKITEQLQLGANVVEDTGKDIDSNTSKLEAYSQAWDDYNLGLQVNLELQDKLTISASEYEKQIEKILTTSREPIVPIITGDNAWDQYTFSIYQFQKASFDANKAITETSQKALEFGERIKGLENKKIKIDLEVEGFEAEKGQPTPFQIFLDDLEFQLNKLPSLQQRVSDFAFAVDDIIRNNLTNAFANLGFTIGETLANGGNVLKAVGASVLTSFADFLGQFGKQLIAYGVATSAFGQASIGLTNPVTAIPAGGVAIAAGIALTAIAGFIGTIGQRGLSGSGGGGGGGVGGGSAAQGTSFTGGATGGMFNIDRNISGEFIVRGTDLVYVLGQANNKINKG